MRLMLTETVGRVIAAGLALCLVACGGDETESGHSLKVIAWNVESDGSDPQTVARRIRDAQGCDIWGLSEVKDSAAASLFEDAATDGEGADFEGVLGSTGFSDRLQVIYDAERFERIEHYELHEINPGGRVRSPLAVRLFDTEAREEFLFVVNHLYRTSEFGRHEQARLLNEWARGQSLPIIAVGDYNFDWDVMRGDEDHDAGYDLLTADGVFTWVRPEAPLVPTQYSEHESVLDFIFVSGGFLGREASATIIVQPGDFPDDATTSDHRPVMAVFYAGDLSATRVGVLAW